MQLSSLYLNCTHHIVSLSPVCPVAPAWQSDSAQTWTPCAVLSCEISCGALCSPEVPGMTLEVISVHFLLVFQRLLAWRLDIQVSCSAAPHVWRENGLQIHLSINKTEEGRSEETRVGRSERLSLYLLLKEVHFFPRHSHRWGVRKANCSSGKQQKLFQFCFSWSDQ